jgi:3-oxoacyl-[acyl-carrier protein] reductase
MPDAVMRTVLVTGGSRGLGLAIAEKLAEAGFAVIAVARKESSQLRAAITKAERKRPDAIRFAPFDLVDVRAIPGFVAGLRKSFGPLYGLVNNAALGTDGALSLMHNARIGELVHLNTLAPIILTKYVVRAMMAAGGGRIVNVASIVALTGYSGLSVYAATKASMVGFTRSLAREVGRMGVNVNAVAPGFLDTEMTSGLDDDLRKKIVGRSAIKRDPISSRSCPPQDTTDRRRRPPARVYSRWSATWRNAAT